MTSNLHIALVGHGSGKTIVKKLGVDRTWGINALNLFIPCDLLFSMHQWPERFDFWGEGPDRERKKQATLDGLKMADKGGTPVFACHTWDAHPCIVPYPIDEVVEFYGIDYFSCSAAYALAYAGYTGGIGRVSLCGITGRENSADQHPCIAYWCGRLNGMGIETISYGGGSDILRTEIQEQAPVSRQWRYGYDHHPPGADKEFTLHLELWHDEMRQSQQEAVCNQQ